MCGLKIRGFGAIVFVAANLVICSAISSDVTTESSLPENEVAYEVKWPWECQVNYFIFF
jgi:hypothetical protein